MLLKPNFLGILQTLTAHDVDFIVVGGVSAVLQGAPVSTFDLDVVHSRDPGNIARLVKALAEMDAYYRGQTGRKLRPNSTHLSSPGHQLLMTRSGPLDLLGVIGAASSYEDLLPHSREIRAGGLTLQILSLDRLIAVKEETGRRKDRALLPILRQTLELKKRRKD